jgi:adenosylmethionine-8-amino-7-oxononanoate aminotransferase
MDPILRKFPHLDRPLTVTHGDGMYLVTESGRRILDTTSGTTSCACLGYSHPAVREAMKRQIDKICHIDYNTWNNPVLDELAELLLSQAPEGLNKVYFAGNSGSEAIEAAMKLSFQRHADAGNKSKTWFIARDQSFHGATLHGIAVSELPILEFYQPILPKQIARIAQHHPLYFRRDDESLDDYAQRSAGHLEAKILEIGPDNVAGFIGETMLASLVGDVPPAPNYWKYVREICDKYDVDLILDEVYCGLGRSGKVYCCSYDDVCPDFLVVGKTLGAGYAPLSAVLTRDRIGTIIAGGQGRIQHGHTHQGHALGTAAALAVQTVVQAPEMLAHICRMGELIKSRFTDELSSHPFFRDVRGRGLAVSFEFKCNDNAGLAGFVQRTMMDRHDVFVNAKWHRIALAPPFIITEAELSKVMDQVIATFLEGAEAYESAA